ncbi:Aste57867_20941 [Aphanomyces stellatus]|uniref:Aste57867_20941 protein n=1 Tax=Aphanomyces stellatus TaxID=120398 RepID=A0A485LKY4_9STRA|nr:hypothetical protein As57867_020873 [Aphanomyces stellatus]VFT97618.1 Aste57867_20941 [Aphanomyces stellatus]
MWAHPQVDSGNSAGCRAAHSCDYIEKDEALYLFGGWSGKNALNDMWRYDLTTLQWRLVHGEGTIPRARNNHASAVVDRKIYVHGGHDGNTWLSDFYVFDTESFTWTTVSTSGTGPSARACHTMSKVGGKLYVFGGFDGAHCFNDVDILDLDTLTWIHPIVHGYHPAPRNAHTMSIVGTSLYMFGGHSGAKHLRDLYEFQTDTLTWTHLASVGGLFPPGLRGHTANVKQPKIYFFGGYDGRGRSNELYILNTNEMAWERSPDTLTLQAPSGRQRHSACLVRSKVVASIYVTGGFDGFKWLDDTHVLDICRIEEQAIKLTTQSQLVAQYRDLLLLQDATYSDITFLVQNKPIVAHKAIVAAQSLHFRRMFSSGMLESRQPTITIADWSYTAFFHMLEFLYTGYVNELTVDSAMELLGLADHYALQELSMLCVNYLVHKLESENVCHVLIAANHYQAESLKASCMRYLQTHFHHVVATRGFDELGEYPNLLLEVTRASMAASTQKHKASADAAERSSIVTMAWSGVTQLMTAFAPRPQGHSSDDEDDIDNNAGQEHVGEDGTGS